MLIFNVLIAENRKDTCFEESILFDIRYLVDYLQLVYQIYAKTSIF